MAITDIKQQNSPSEGSIRDALDIVKKEVKQELNCHAIGTIKTFDKDKQTASITINYQKTYFRRLENGVNEPFLVPYPTLIDVPCIKMMGGDFAIRMPIRAGDTCLVLFNDRDMDKWFASGQQAQGVATPRLHSLSDGIALVGLSSVNAAISGYEDDKMVLGSDSCSISIGEKIGIQNNAQDLKSILQDLITQIKAITVMVGGVPTPIDNIAAFAPISTAVGDLLE